MPRPTNSNSVKAAARTSFSVYQWPIIRCQRGSRPHQNHAHWRCKSCHGPCRQQLLTMDIILSLSRQAHDSCGPRAPPSHSLCPRRSLNLQYPLPVMKKLGGTRPYVPVKMLATARDTPGCTTTLVYACSRPTLVPLRRPSTHWRAALKGQRKVSQSCPVAPRICLLMFTL